MASPRPGCYHALRADSSADDQLVVLARLWLVHRFDADARTNHGGEAVDVVVAVALEVRGKVRVDAHDDVLAWYVKEYGSQQLLTKGMESNKATWIVLPMAVIGGLASSTLLTLVAVPLLYLELKK